LFLAIPPIQITIREKKALEDAKRDAAKRARAWMQLKQMPHWHGRDEGGGGGMGSGGLGDLGGDGGGGTSVAARREQLSTRDDAPAQYIEARHAQAEKRAQQIVEDALMQQGLDLYKYREG
jgi:hypothetical protein